MSNIIHYFFVLSAVSIFATFCVVQFIPERVKLVHSNQKYFEKFSINIRRYGRKSGHYINTEMTTKVEWNNNVTINIIFNEFLHNEYRRSFIEMHYKYCDLLKYDKFFAPMFIKYGLLCPFPAGKYQYINLTVPTSEFPSVFPFERARIDLEYAVTATKESMIMIYFYCSLKNKITAND